MSSIETRLTALSDAVQRRALEQIAPVDPLSASLFALRDELSGLDDAGRAALLEAMNHPTDGESDSLRLSADDINKFIESIVKG